MPRPVKGQRTPGSGRKPGVQNHNRQTVLELVRKHGKDPLVVLSEIAGGPDKEKASWAATQLMPYCYPKLSAVQVSEDPENPIGAGAESKTLQELKNVIALAAAERKSK